MIDVPTTEPEALVAGDTWQWRRDDLTTFAADNWVLTYRFLNASGKIEITATVDGDGFLVNVQGATTSGHNPGVYGWEAHVSKDNDRHTVGSGKIEVCPNFAALEALDTRSHAEICLDNISAVLERRSTKDQDGYSIDGRRLDRTSLPDLQRLQMHYQRLVNREKGIAPRRVYTKIVG